MGYKTGNWIFAQEPEYLGNTYGRNVDRMPSHELIIQPDFADILHIPAGRIIYPVESLSTEELTRFKNGVLEGLAGLLTERLNL